MSLIPNTRCSQAVPFQRNSSVKGGMFSLNLRLDSFGCRVLKSPRTARRCPQRWAGPRRVRECRAQEEATPQVAVGGTEVQSAIPTSLNTIPHSREIRRHFYAEVADGVKKALAGGSKRISTRCTIPELNLEFDVYRAGTLLEMVREIALLLTADGRKVKVCVQQPLGQGVFQGMPLSLNGVPRIMKQMDWGGAAPFLTQGQIGADQVDDADAYILVAPMNIVGHTIVPYVEEMVGAAEAAGKPVILVNANLGDIPSANGVMGIRGRQDRQDFIKTFDIAYHFRLLYIGASMYPIMGCLKYTYGGEWEVFKRYDLGQRREEYRLIGTFAQQPGPAEITECFSKAPKQQQ